MAFHIRWLPTSYIPLSPVVRIFLAEKPEQRVLESENSESPGLWQSWSLWCEHWVCSTMTPPCEPPGGWMPWVFLYSSGFFFHAICAWLRDMAVQAGRRAGMAPIPPLQRGRKLPLWASKSQVRRIPQQTDMALMAPTISTSSSTQSFDTPLISIAVGHREQTANTNCAKCQQDFSEFC